MERITAQISHNCSILVLVYPYFDTFLDMFKDLTFKVEFELVFTNISKELFLKILKKLWRFVSANISLHYKTLAAMIKFLFAAYYFFPNRIYQQVYGTASGNSASYILSNLVMNNLVTKCLKNIPFNITFLKMYVDDTILAEKILKNLYMQLYNKSYSKFSHIKGV